MRKRFIHILWALLAGGIVSAIVGFFAIWFGWIGYMPDIEDLQNPINRFATQVYSSDGKVIGTWNLNKENRIVIPYKKMSPYLVQALVATEDERFYEHSGIDFRALGRAIIKRGILGQANAGGGSTITQQLAKQLYSSTAQSAAQRMLQKPIEWVIAIKLERYYTKEEIIALYLNYFDFLHNAVGIKTAANTYFNKEPKNLTVCEAATLIGLCKNPSLFNPVRYPERAKERRNVVLSQMVKAVGMLMAPEAIGRLHFFGCFLSASTSMISFKQYIDEAVKLKAKNVITAAMMSSVHISEPPKNIGKNTKVFFSHW